MATLVTGGTGFVGCNIVRVLAARGHQVISLDIAPPDDMVRKYLDPWKGKVTWIQSDILDRSALEEVAASHDIEKIVHAAVYTGTRADIEKSNSHRVVDINISGTINVLDTARRLSVKRFLYVSSGGVYAGKRLADEPLREEMALFPINLYDISKYACEMLTKRYGDLHGFNTVSVRLSSPYGPMERVTGHRAVMSLVYDWTGRALRSEPIDLSRTTPDRDYTYVLDTATAIATVLDAPSLNHGVYNIGRGRKVTLDEMTTAMKQVYPAVKFIEPSPEVQKAPAPRYGRGPMDISRLRELGYAPEHDIAAGLREYIAWREEFSFRD